MWGLELVYVSDINEVSDFSLAGMDKSVFDFTALGTSG